MIQIPEIKLKSLLDAILDRVKADYEGNTVKEQTFLYRMFYGLVVGNYDFYSEAVRVFNRKFDDPRTIDTRMMFDRERAAFPTIHVTVPNDNPISDGIGFDEGYHNPDIEDVNGELTNFTRGYNSQFDLVITGSNTFEVILIYTTLRAALINNHMSLEMNGFRNPKISGGDLRINDQIMPVSYMRVIHLNSFFELTVPDFGNIQLINTLKFPGKAIN